MSQVFICYSRKDSDFVDRLTADLIAAGIPTWMDRSHLHNDELASEVSWRRSVNRALQESTHMIVVLSPDAVDSPEVESEWSFFLQHGPIFPIIYRKCEVPYRLRVLQLWDMQTDYQVMMKRLVDRIKRAIGEKGESLGPALPLQTPMSMPISYDPPKLIVSQLGRGSYRSISDAIAAAPAGAQILVMPGFYNDRIVIDKPLEIIGDGPVEEIVVESSKLGDCLVMQTDYATVRGLTLLGWPSGHLAVSIPTGRLVLENCSIRDGFQCVSVEGQGASPIIRRCNIHGGTEDGVEFSDGAMGTIEDCEIAGNEFGISITRRANPIIRHCRIHDNQTGVIACESGQGVIDNCEIYQNDFVGVSIHDGSNLDVQRCRIRENDFVAVWVSDRGVARIRNCDLTDNGAYAFEIDDGCAVDQEDNKE